MERWCCVESKTFVFSVREGASVVRVEERRGRFSGRVLLGAQSCGWLLSTLESVLRFIGKDFVRSFRDGSKVFIVRRGGNSAGSFIEVAAYALGGLKGIIYIPEGRNGWGWSRFLAELGKTRDFLSDSARKVLVRTGPSPVMERVHDNGAGTDAAIGSTSDKAPSFAEVLCSGPRRPEEEGEKQVQPEYLLGKDHHDRYAFDTVQGVRSFPILEAKSPAVFRGKSDYSFGEKSDGFQKFGRKDTFPSLLLWQSQLEKLKYEVDRALSSVREGLLLVGPGFKPNGDRRKKKKNRKKKKLRTCWVPKSKPNPRECSGSEPLAVSGSGGQESALEGASTSDGLCLPPTTITSSENTRVESASRPERGSRPVTLDADTREEKEAMGIARSAVQSEGCTEADGGVSAPLEIQALVSNSKLVELGPGPLINAGDTGFCQPLLCAGGQTVPALESLTSQPVSNNGSELPGSRLEVVPKIPEVPATVRMGSDSVLVVWAGYPSEVEAEDASITLFSPSGLGPTNGMKLIEPPEEEPAPLCCCPGDNFRGYSGKKSPMDFLKAVLEYSQSVGVTCDGYEGQLSAVFEAILAENDKKETGSSLKAGNKFLRELNRLSCSINYDARSGSSSQSRSKGRANGGIL
jgi:hypothetical protein